jgi:hypothetical protein
MAYGSYGGEEHVPVISPSGREEEACFFIAGDGTTFAGFPEDLTAVDEVFQGTGKRRKIKRGREGKEAGPPDEGIERGHIILKNAFLRVPAMTAGGAGPDVRVVDVNFRYTRGPFGFEGMKKGLVEN